MCGWGQVGNEHVSGKGHIQVSRSVSKVKIRQQIPAFLSLHLIYIWLTEWASGVWLPARRLPYLDKGSGEASLLPLGPTWPFWIDAARSESCSKLCLLFDATRDAYTEKVCKALYRLVTPPSPYETLHSQPCRHSSSIISSEMGDQTRRKSRGQEARPGCWSGLKDIKTCTSQLGHKQLHLRGGYRRRSTSECCGEFTG